MTERLADVSRRIGSVGQLAAVIGAMRAMAAARSRDARARLDGVRAYERAVAEAIGQALAMTPEDGAVSALDGASGSHAIVAFTAEQGFAGPFNTRVLDAAQRLSEQARPRRVQLLLLGGRGLLAARQRDIEIAWSHAMIAHLDQAPALADAIQGQLFEGLGSGSIARVTALYAAPEGSGETEIVERTLAPFDFTRFPRARSRAPPLTTMAPAALLARLADEYVFGEIYEALILSFAAENQARLKAMTSARSHISDLLERLNGRARTLRQEEITNEIVELAADADALVETGP